MVEGIKHENVSSWILDVIEGLTLPLEFELIAGGHSNLTYRFVDATGRAFVLRRPPLGHILESAHDMGREFRIISALGASNVPVPKTYGYCEDKIVNDHPFYVMEFVEGIVPHSAATLEQLSTEERRSFGLHVVQVLADLHMTDVDAIGLGQLAKKEAYLERQLKRWTQQWLATKTAEIPDMDRALVLLHEKHPEQIGTAVVHGDYRPGNMLIKDGRMSALLDWELCTLGDPLADVGYLLNNWAEPGDPASETAPTSIGGFPSRDEMSGLYAEKTGRSLVGINYYRAFSHWRLAAIAQGVYKRYSVGAMGDQEFDLDKYMESIVTKARLAVKLLSSPKSSATNSELN